MTAALVACGGTPSAPTTPTVRPPGTPVYSAGTTVTLRSGETDQPVAGAAVTVSGISPTGAFTTSYVTDAAGQFAFDRGVNRSPFPSFDVDAGGFLRRTTQLRDGDPLVFTLWPSSSPTGLDGDFSETLVYSSSSCPAKSTGTSALRRPSLSTDVVQIWLSADLQNGSTAGTMRGAVDQMNAALGGTPRYEFTSAPTPGAVSFVVELDANDPNCGTVPGLLYGVTYLDFQAGNVSGGRLVFCSPGASFSARLVLHEVGHTFGLYHSSSASDVMYCTSGRPAKFSERERLAMRLMRLRNSGTRWPDNDRQATTAPDTAAESVAIACSARQ